MAPRKLNETAANSPPSRSDPPPLKNMCGEVAVVVAIPHIGVGTVGTHRLNLAARLQLGGAVDGPVEGSRKATLHEVAGQHGRRVAVGVLSDITALTVRRVPFQPGFHGTDRRA